MGSLLSAIALRDKRNNDFINPEMTMMNINSAEMPNRTHLIVFGYVHRYRLDFPIDVLNIVLIYYYYYKFCQFHTEKHGKYLSFIDDITVSTNCSCWNIFLYGSPVTNSICNKYRIHFTLESDVNYCFMFGYAGSIKDIVTWNDSLPGGRNTNAVGLLVHHFNNFFRLYNNDPNTLNGLRLKYSAKKNFRNGDTYGLCFDFVNDKLGIYHDFKEVEVMPLDGHETIIPLFSMYYGTFKILKQEFL